MTASLLAVIPAPSPHDSGVRDIATLSARFAYVTMCLTLAWGVLSATGWIRRVTGHEALRGGHVVLAAFTLATGVVHGLSYLFLDDGSFGFVALLIPFAGGGFARHAAGVVGLELFIAVSVTAALRRGVVNRSWQRFHQAGYLSVGLLVIHSWLGAAANGNLATVWLGGITVLTPAVVLTVLRVLPPRALVRLGLLDGDTGRAAPVRISVDDKKCHRYAICQAEAPQVFQLQGDGQLRYLRKPGAKQVPLVQAAARACPMRAIQLQGAGQ
ncbi:4Fe-4S domain-containing protein [Amycolatopsis umgeniensis]|uniref:Ferredoxin/DMSO/TMAO reductase YedYZ heme-binding membrane subunit n=1 Tax=Amycolatopsis umgeniensis TaxID=336628 RepID=A0A841B5D5_9PSEU|nr:ferredoxin [Amycolatopsis umgeniensis]MBB5855296.1 ferredoxin/DMSO/TMAO reductase YedYZ heme-binding membrane subunit [Amycolatopsis umgeniensis]